jgi:CheY-like chemotaxis protein
MLILYEAFMRCSYCGSRVLHKLNTDEVTALREGTLPRRHCDFCVGQTEWKLQDWKGSPPPEVVEASKGADGEAAPPRAPDRILVIDDDDLTAILLRKVLEAENCVLEVANDGKEALQKLMEQRYSLVVCDIHMPNMDGKKLFEFVDQHALESKNRIIFLTGDTSSATRQFLESTGCPYMHKPIQILQFASMVREILDTSHTTEA